MLQPINMMALTNSAIHYRQKFIKENLAVNFKNLMSHGFVAMERAYSFKCNQKGELFEDQMYYAVRDYLLYLAFDNGNFNDEEYLAFSAFCTWKSQPVLNKAQCKKTAKGISAKRVSQILEIFASVRENVEADRYYYFVLALSLYCVLSSKKISKEQYANLLCLYDVNWDVLPENFKDFKKHLDF